MTLVPTVEAEAFASATFSLFWRQLRAAEIHGRTWWLWCEGWLDEPWTQN